MVLPEYYMIFFFARKWLFDKFQGVAPPPPPPASYAYACHNVKCVFCYTLINLDRLCFSEASSEGVSRGCGTASSGSDPRGFFFNQRVHLSLKYSFKIAFSTVLKGEAFLSISDFRNLTAKVCAYLDNPVKSYISMF